MPCPAGVGVQAEGGAAMTLLAYMCEEVCGFMGVSRIRLSDV